MFLETLFLDLPLVNDGEDKSSPLKNRIRKNFKHLKKWAKRTQTNCFRLYDRDIKEFPIAIDFYAGRYRVHYFSFNRNAEEVDPDLKAEVEETLGQLFGADPSQIYDCLRIKRKKTEQYEKLSGEEEFFTVLEFGLKFKVNLVSYLDTGLFLDHRETRRFVASLAKGKRLLNLFAYTCSFSLHAAALGAAFTKSIDLSNTYTEWGRENFQLNGLNSDNHLIERADCLKFLDEEIKSRTRYDVIVIDPPTLSRSKKMDSLFDIQQDHPHLLLSAAKLLNPDGTLIFSTNSRKFKLENSLHSQFAVQEITEKTIPLDFHNKKIHRCWLLKKSKLF